MILFGLIYLLQWCWSVLQHVATHCSAPRHTEHCNTLQHAATCCNTLHHTATHCAMLHHTAPCCNTLQHTATHCNTATRCNTLHHILAQPKMSRYVLQCIAVCCTMLHCVAACCRVCSIVKFRSRKKELRGKTGVTADRDKIEFRLFGSRQECDVMLWVWLTWLLWVWRDVMSVTWR